MSQYKKFFTSLLATLGVSAVAVFSDNMVTSVEAINMVVVFFTTASVLGAGNLPVGVWKYTKGYMAAGGAGATLLVTLMGSGGFENVQTSGWIQIALAAASAVGVVAIDGPVVIESNRIQDLA